jgi:hypothetical protein
MPSNALKLPNFPRLLFSYWVNQFGDYAAEIALAVAVYAATGSAVAVAATWFTHRCLLGLLAPLVVSRVDHLRVERLLPAIYVAEAALFVALIAAVSHSLVAVLALVALDGLLAPVARAVARSTLVSITRPAGLHREGNSIVNVVFIFNCVAAPAAGGLLVATLGAPIALALDAASFVLAAAALAGCRLPRPSGNGAPAATRLREALAYVRERPVLRGLVVNHAMFSLFVQATIPIEVVFVTKTLHGSDAAFGAVVAAWGAGMIVGGIVYARWSGANGPAALLATASLQAAGCLGMGLSPTVTAVIVWSVVGGLGNGVYGMAFMTAFQERTEDAFQARVNSLLEALLTIVPGAGFLAGGALAAIASPRAVYVFAGVGALAVTWRAAAALRPADWSVTAAPARA